MLSSWPGCPVCCPAPWSTSCPQTLRCHRGLPGHSTKRRSQADSSGAGAASAPTFSRARASTQHHTCPGTPPKKRALAPPTSDSASVTYESWQTRYEQLRSQILQMRGTSVRCGWGQALVEQRGLAAWMKAWPLPTTTPLPLPEATPTQDASPLPMPIQEELVQILVNTILCHVQEVFA